MLRLLGAGGMDLRALIAKLDDTCRETLEAAAGLTLTRTHYNVEVEHWLLRLLERPSDVTIVLDHYGVDRGRLSSDLNRSLDRMKAGAGRAPSLSPHLVKLIREAWLLASLELGAKAIRSGHVLTALVSDPDLGPAARETCSQLEKLPPGQLAEQLSQLTATSPETQSPASSSAAPAPESAAPQGSGALDKFCIDLTARARAGEIDSTLR